VADLFSTNFVESKSRNSAHGSPVQRRLVCSRRYGNWIARNGPAQLSATLISGRVRILQNLASLSCTRERGLHIDLFRSYCTVQSARVFRCFTLSWETALRCFRSEFTEFHNGRLYKSQQGETGAVSEPHTAFFQKVVEVDRWIVMCIPAPKVRLCHQFPRLQGVILPRRKDKNWGQDPRSSRELSQGNSHFLLLRQLYT